MKGTIEIELNQTTMLEALQMYFDDQLTIKHKVSSVSAGSSVGYNTAPCFKVTLIDYVAPESKE